MSQFLRARFQNRWRSRADDPRLIAAFDAIKRGDYSAGDIKILYDYAWDLAENQARRAGVQDVENHAAEVASRVIIEILSCRLTV